MEQKLWFGPDTQFCPCILRTAMILFPDNRTVCTIGLVFIPFRNWHFIVVNICITLQGSQLFWMVELSIRTWYLITFKLCNNSTRRFGSGHSTLPLLLMKLHMCSSELSWCRFPNYLFNTLADNFGEVVVVAVNYLNVAIATPCRAISGKQKSMFSCPCGFHSLLYIFQANLFKCGSVYI